MNAVAVPLSSGEVALVDAADAALVRRFRWRKRPIGRNIYAQRHVQRPDGSHTTQLLHTLITGWSHVDHRNGNGLDNRRANLRLATDQQNQQNQATRGGMSRYKGVSWNSRERCWRVQIRIHPRRIWVGRFASEESAARAYDAAAREHFGEFAALNFPLPGERCALAPQAGRPAVADPGVLKLPAAVCPTVLPRGAAAGTLPARPGPAASPRYRVGRAAVGGAR